jgi:uncharacterized coiled-coil protein SlyX
MRSRAEFPFQKGLRSWRKTKSAVLLPRLEACLLKKSPYPVKGKAALRHSATPNFRTGIVSASLRQPQGEREHVSISLMAHRRGTGYASPMSENIDDIAARLEALEAHLAHQDRIITDLNEVVTTQYRKIDRLERLIERLRESMLSLAPQRDGPEPPPPHY